jgi:hypothetical protein
MPTENQEHNCEAVAEQGFDIQAIGLENQGQYGHVAEAKFLAKASSMGFGVATPWGVERYDFIVDSGYCFSRVQVKSTQQHRKRGGYRVQVVGGNLPYDETEIDFLAAYIAPEDVWYVIPIKKLKNRRVIYLYPKGQKKSKWEKYREGWCQMACPYEEIGPSKIVTPRCRDNGPVRMMICPLKV